MLGHAVFDANRQSPVVIGLIDLVVVVPQREIQVAAKLIRQRIQNVCGGKIRRRRHGNVGGLIEHLLSLSSGESRDQRLAAGRLLSRSMAVLSIFAVLWCNSIL